MRIKFALSSLNLKNSFSKFLLTGSTISIFIFLFLLLSNFPLISENSENSSGNSIEKNAAMNLLKKKLDKIREIANELPENFNKEQEDKAKQDSREELESLIDKTHIAMITLGEKRWNKLQISEKDKFQKLFQKLLINKLTLAGKKKKVSKSKKENLKKFKAIKLNIIKQISYNDKLFNKAEAVLVRTMVPGQEIDIPIDFMFYQVIENKLKTKIWKVYDIHIDGKSTIWYYRRQFIRIINKRGFTYLLKRLEMIVNK